MNRFAKYISIVIASSIIVSVAVFPKNASSVDLEGIDLAFINGGSDGYVYGDLHLPETDGEGNEIMWTAKDDSIVDPDTGKILKYTIGGTIATSVTATVNGESEEIPFEIAYINNRFSDIEPFYEETFDNYTTGNIQEIIDSNPEDTLNDIANTEGILDTDATSNNASNIGGLEIAQENTNKVMKTLDAGVHVFYFSRAAEFANVPDNNLVVSMRIKSTSGTEFYANLGSGSYSSKAKVRLSLTENGALVNNDSSIVTSDNTNYHDGEYHTITFMLDKMAGTNGTFTMWVDNKLLCKDVECYKTIKTGWPDGLYLRGSENVCVDDIKLLQAEEMMSEITLSLINGEDSNIVRENLYLPRETEKGEEISWESENGNITVDGEEGIINPDNTQKEDVLIASVVLDGITYMKQFELIIPKYEKTFSSVPTPTLDEDGKEIIVYEENFNDTSIEKLIEEGHLRQAQVDVGDMSVSGGKLVINTTGGQAHHHYSVADAVSQIDDRLVIEFEATRSSINGFLCLFTSANSISSAKVYTAFQGSVLIATSDNTKAHAVKENYDVIGRASKISMMIFKDNTFSLWVDGERLVNREKTRNDVSEWATDVNFRNADNMGKLEIDNLRIYKGSVSQIEMTDSVLESIKEDEDIIIRDESGEIVAFGYEDENEHGCSVEFSDDNNLTDSDGTIHFPLKNTETEVTVTVTSPEGYAESKTFLVGIPANYILKDIKHKVNTLGLVPGENEFIINAQSRGNEPEDGVSVRVEIFDAQGNSVVSGSVEGQYLLDDARYFIGIVDITQQQIPENPKIKITLFDKETGELLQDGEFEIIGG